MFSKTKYYDSADIIPIGRYMLATCKDLRYFAIGELPKKVHKKRLIKSVNKLNKSILKDSQQTKVLKDIKNLSIDESKIYLHSALVAVVDYANTLLNAGVDQNIILQKLAPIKPLLIERGLSPDSRRNAQRLEKVKRNFLIKSDEIKNRLKNEKIASDDIYKNYLTNLILIEKSFGIKIDEQKDSLNKYVLLIDQIKKDGDRLK